MKRDYVGFIWGRRWQCEFYYKIIEWSELRCLNVRDGQKRLGQTLEKSFV